MRATSALLLLGLVCLLPSADAGAAPDFFGIGGIDGKSYTSIPFAAPGDPLEVVSQACTTDFFSAECEPFRWTPEGPSVPLGLLPGDTYGYAWDLSGDGHVVVGASRNEPTSSRGGTAVRWVGNAAPETLATHSESIATSATHITPDGTVIAGTWSEASGFRAFAWTESMGLVELLEPSLPLLGLSKLTGLSDAGQIAAYLRQYSSGSSSTRAIRWTVAGGVELLGPLPSGYVSSDTEDIAEQTGAITGNLWTGNQYGSDSLAYVWTEASGLQALPLPAGHLESDAQRISGDGTAVAGQFPNPAASPLEREAFRWTAATGIQSLGPAPGFEETGISSLSDDGATLSGYLHNDTLELVYEGQNAPDEYEERIERRGFLWREGTGRVDLPILEISPTCDHDPWHIIDSFSPDGAVAFGRAKCDEADTFAEYQDPYTGEWFVEWYRGDTLRLAFAWDENNGFRSLEDFVQTEYGVDLTGWTLSRLEIADDGQILKGSGIQDNQDRGWILYASASLVPSLSPSGMALLGGLVFAVASAGLAVQRRRRLL